jgi:homoserine dehydrogenase
MSDLPVLPMSEIITAYYLRLRVADQAGVLATVTGLLAAKPYRITPLPSALRH